MVDYEHGLSFATVHGSGHMVPTFRPRAALKLLEHVVRGTPFSPPVATDDELAAMSATVATRNRRSTSLTDLSGHLADAPTLGRADLRLISAPCNYTQTQHLAK